MKTPVITDMLQETGLKFGRAAVACACAAAMTVSSPARAQEPEGPKTAAEATDELTPEAEKETAKAVEHFNNGAYVDAEEAFNRVAFFVPNWRPLHFNLAVVAEAQGKIGLAVREYKKFKPLATQGELPRVDQRIDELGRRQQRIAGAYKRQIALFSTGMVLGLGAVGGAAALFVVMSKRAKEADELRDEADMLANTVPYDDPAYQQYQTAAQERRDDATALEKNKNGFLYGGVYLAIFGLVVVAASIVPMRNAIKSKRQLDGFALGPTRLQWTGGAGVRLRF
jgi:hypothetical protein